MAKVKCGICGRNVDTLKGNYVFANNIHQHRKCPTEKLNRKDNKDWRDLKRAIFWLIEKQGKKISSAEENKIYAQIKQLKDDGYSYQDQLYAFKWYFDPSKKNEFKSYGIVAFIIEEALKEREEEMAKFIFLDKKEKDEEEMKKIMEQKRKERLKKWKH